MQEGAGMAETETTADATEITVRALLAAARLSPSEEEVAELVAMYPDYKAGIEALYAVPETRYASPALVFDAAPIFTDWTG
jgi:hypothetical protein